MILPKPTLQLFFVCFLVIAATTSFSLWAQRPETEWQAGAASVDITPQTPLWLAGYAARTKAAEGTLLPLKAKALALKDAAGHCAVVVTTDICGYPIEVADRIHSKVEERFGLTKENMILSASHTHSGPVVGASLKCMYSFDAEEEAKLIAYTDRFIEDIVTLVGTSLDRLEAAHLLSGNGTARFAVNRRNNVESALKPTSDLEGPNDHAVPVLQVLRSDGSPMAVLFGYACHATVLDGYEWSGDYPGYAQEALENQYPGMTALFFAGCGADQNPLPRRTVALARQYGVTLAAAVTAVLEGGAMTPQPAALTTLYKEIPLDLESVPDEAALRERIANTGGYEQQCTEALLNRVLQDGALAPQYPYPVQSWKIGDQWLVVLGGEVAVDYSIAIKEQLGQQVFVMAYSNDLMAYIPSERIREEGGYEGAAAQIIFGLPSAWAPGLQNRILNEVWKQTKP